MALVVHHAIVVSHIPEHLLLVRVGEKLAHLGGRDASDLSSTTEDVALHGRRPTTFNDSKDDQQIELPIITARTAGNR